MKKYSFYALPLFACLPAFCKAEELRECIPYAGPKSMLVGPIFGIQQNNCQDWGQRMRDMYWKLLEDPKVVCECRVGLQIVR